MTLTVEQIVKHWESDTLGDVKITYVEGKEIYDVVSDLEYALRSVKSLIRIITDGVFNKMEDVYNEGEFIMYLHMSIFDKSLAPIAIALYRGERISQLCKEYVAKNYERYLDL